MRPDNTSFALYVALDTLTDEYKKDQVAELMDYLLADPKILQAPADVTLSACYMLMLSVASSYGNYLEQKDKIDGEDGSQ